MREAWNAEYETSLIRTCMGESAFRLCAVRVGFRYVRGAGFWVCISGGFGNSISTLRTVVVTRQKRFSVGNVCVAMTQCRGVSPV